MSIPDNGKRGLATHQAMIVLFDATTGVPLAVMDGRLITELRTAAVSAVATKLLAPAGVSSLAILGSGVQARAHFRALSLVRKFDGCPSLEPQSAERERARRGDRRTGLLRRRGGARRRCRRHRHQFA